jgi:hypothetical protein
VSVYFGKQWLLAESECVLTSSGHKQSGTFWQAMILSRVVARRGLTQAGLCTGCVQGQTEPLFRLVQVWVCVLASSGFKQSGCERGANTGRVVHRMCA